MKDILGREIKDGDMCIGMAIGRNSPGMHIGVFQGSSVVYLGYSEEYINKSCTSNTYLIENPTKKELEIRDKINIFLQKEAEERERKANLKTIPLSKLEVGGIYKSTQGEMYLYLGKKKVIFEDFDYGNTDIKEGHCFAFFKNHNLITFPHKVEHFITIKISDDIYMQGYIDMLYVESYKDENGNEKKRVHIVDWKTSTRYQGAKIDAECGQLVIYAEGIRQALNIPLEDIVCEWNFLKYVTVTIEQKNGKKKDRYIERNSIGESLINTAKMWLKNFGYEDDIDKYVDEMVLNNNIDCLPDEVREKFEIHDCYVQVPLTEEKINDLKEDIINTVEEINSKEREYKNSEDENIFWQEVTDADEFRLATLSGYSRSLHKPYDQYLKEKELFKEETKSDSDADEDDLLAFVNSL